MQGSSTLIIQLQIALARRCWVPWLPFLLSIGLFWGRTFNTFFFFSPFSMLTICGWSFAAGEMERVCGCLVHILLKHHGRDPDPLLASKPLRFGKLRLFFFRSRLSLQDAWCLLFYQSPCVNRWLQIVFYSMRTSYVKLLLRINFGELSFPLVLCIYCFVMQFCGSFAGGMLSVTLYILSTIWKIWDDGCKKWE